MRTAKRRAKGASQQSAAVRAAARSALTERERELEEVEAAEREVWQVPAPSESRQQRRERRAARRAREAEADTPPAELPVPEVVMSPWVPIVWFVVPLVLVIVWSLIDGWLHP